MGRACSTNGGDEECMRKRRRRPVNDIKMDLREIGWYGLSDLAQDRDQWRALVNTVMNFRVP
jgi:hypothetical protein